MRAAVEILILSVAVFAAAFVTRRMFLWDVMPVSWDQEPPQNGALEAAYFLLSVENLAGIVAAIALGMIVVLFLRRRRHNRAQGA